MEIKVGDKVKIIREYSSDKGKFGIVVMIPTEDQDGRVFIDRYNNYCIDCEIPIEQQIELVEVANYVPVPKFHIGDIVYYELSYYKGHILKGIVVTGRSDNMNYLVSDIGDDAWNSYREGATMRGIKENELSKDMPKSVTELSKDKPQEDKPE